MRMKRNCLGSQCGMAVAFVVAAAAATAAVDGDVAAAAAAAADAVANIVMSSKSRTADRQAAHPLVHLSILWMSMLMLTVTD